MSANSKRIKSIQQCSHHEERSQVLECLICHQVVNDAVQMRCCGGLFCRRCILLWLRSHNTCPNCRTHAKLYEIQTDLRSERLAADAIRPCDYAYLGCVFKGNRQVIAHHARDCDCVSRAMLVSENFDLRTQLQEVSKKFAYCIQAALGPNPTSNALKLLHVLDSSYSVLEIKRKKRSFIHCCKIRRGSAEVSVDLHQSKSVGLQLKKLDSFHISCDITVSLLHPSDNLLTITVTFVGETISVLQKNEKIGFEEVMPLQSFDDYCIGGYFFVALKGFLLEDDEVL